MNKWQVQIFDELRELATPAQIAARIGWATTELDFSHYTCGLWAPLPLSNPALDCAGNTPNEWQQCYRHKRYAQHDPLVRHARRSMEPLVWNDTVFADCPELAVDARQHGLLAGWTMASLNAQGMRGLLTLSRHGPALSAPELREKEADMRWLAYMANLFVTPQLAKKEVPPCTGLTNRESEVLRWSGDGKTTGEIASILEVSDNTVNYYLKNAMTKLRAANKTAAVVIALTHGLLGN